MSIFKFKQFEVVNERSSMKVNTDGVLIGAAASLYDSTVNVLDVGTGTGTIALIVAQRLSEKGVNAHITGIDIDAPSAQEAEYNFTASPWKNNLKALRKPLQECSTRFEKKSLDLIISNPPYFDDTLAAPEKRRNAARHASVDADGGSSLGWGDLLDFSKDFLSENGHLSIILPADQEKALLRYGRTCGLFPFRILRIRTTERKPIKRLVVEFSLARVESPIDETLTMMEKGKYTREYISLVSDFYLNIG